MAKIDITGFLIKEIIFAEKNNKIKTKEYLIIAIDRCCRKFTYSKIYKYNYFIVKEEVIRDWNRFTRFEIMDI